MARMAADVCTCRAPHADSVTFAAITQKDEFMLRFTRWGRMVFASLIALAILPLPLTHGQESGPEAVAQAMVDNLIAEDYEAAIADFDETMASLMPVSVTQQTWESILAQVGAYQDQLAIQSQEVEEYTVVVITLQFERAVIDVQVSVNGSGKIGGLYFRPGQAPQPDWEPPAYADPSAFTERDITLNAGTDWELPGTLTLPNGDGPFPAVALVHGSGPNDRDESIGPNKVFRDLAWGLASNGIAALRYDKHTRIHGQAMAGQPELTVQEETIDDALAAAALLRDTDGIDPQRVFVLGHSLGGYLAPRIAAQTDSLAGLILLAGNTRPLEVLTLEQVDYLLSLDGELSEDEQAQLEALAAEVEQLQTLDDTVDPSTTVLDIPAAYWLDLRGYDPVAVAQTLDIPMLILQGERDYQVTMVDFQGWQDGLAGHENVTFNSYPDLNHLFISGEGPSAPAEYEQPGHVAGAVLGDITSWILSH